MLNQQHILIIDDDPDILVLSSNALRRQGYMVQTLMSCEKLFDLVERFSPHLIFMDHNMPKVCGSDAIKMLKSNNSTKHIPVILSSAELNIEQLAREAGADHFLKKPFKMESLIAWTEKMAIPIYDEKA